MRVFIAIHMCPRAPLIARSPGSDFSSGTLRSPDKRILGCFGTTSVDEKDGARAAPLFHAVSHRDCGPTASSVGALNDQAHVVPGHEQMIRIVGINDGRIEILPISAWRHAGVGPTHTAIRRFPETKAGAAYARRVKDRRLSIRTSRNGEPSRSACPGSAASGIDRAGPCEAIIHRLPDALTMELRVKIRWPCRVGDHGDRPEIFAGQWIYQIDPLGGDVSPCPFAETGADLSYRTGRREVRQGD